MDTSLYLYPLPPLAEPPSLEKVIGLLQELDFVGEPLAPQRWQVGSRFFQYLTFAGCSPHLRVTPREAGDWRFTHIRLGLEETPPLRITPLRGRPRCPNCGQPLAEWRSQLAAWRQAANQPVTCVACGAATPVAELDWRHYGVAARLCLEVTQVWPGEALPGDPLLEALQKGAGRPWGYAWAESA